MAKILLVDDDPLQAFGRKFALETRFHHVERAADAAEALCLIEQPLFAKNLDLVISGIRMPGISGPAFIAELHSRVPSIPVMVLESGFEGADDYAGGFVRFMPKPVANADMIVAADQMLSFVEPTPH
jgi:CheY-like chemotaxis protein